MFKQTKSFSPRFWTPPKQRKEDLSKKDIKTSQKISDIDIYDYKQIKDLFPEISSHLKLFFNDNLKFENVKIEFVEHYESLEISFKRDEKHLNYLIERCSEYKFKIAMWEIMKISVDFKDLYKFLGIMGEQYEFQNFQDLRKCLQPNKTKDPLLYNSRFFSTDKGNVSPSGRSNIKFNLQDYNSLGGSTESSTESPSVKQQCSDFVYEVKSPRPGIRV